VAAVNGCEYCDAAHTFTGYTFAKLSKEEVDLPAKAPRPIRTLQRPRLCSQGSRGSGQGFGRRHRGIRQAGFSDSQIVEIVAVVAENFFTNLINNVAGTDVDFPRSRV
jgi:alkylhydroperoxidase family enzyme